MSHNNSLVTACVRTSEAEFDRNWHPYLDRFLVSTRGSQAQPHQRLHISRHAEPHLVTQADTGLGKHVSLLGREAVPFRRLLFVLRRAATVVVHDPEVVPALSILVTVTRTPLTILVVLTRARGAPPREGSSRGCRRWPRGRFLFSRFRFDRIEPPGRRRAAAGERSELPGHRQRWPNSAALTLPRAQGAARNDQRNLAALITLVVLTRPRGAPPRLEPPVPAMVDVADFFFGFDRRVNHSCCAHAPARRAATAGKQGDC